MTSSIFPTRFALLLACAAACAWAPGAGARDAMPPAILKSLETLRAPPNSVSIFVQDARSDEIVLAFNADAARQPASTIKTLTTIAALDLLGPAYAWKTRAYVTGSVRRGALDGDLIIVGGGDPYMVSERWWSFVSQLRQTGLSTIDGDIVIDRSYFAQQEEDRASFDGQPYRSYNVIPDALMVNFQTSKFTIGADAAPSGDGKFANISIDPLPANLELDNQVRLGAGNCRRAQQGLRFSMPQGPAGNTLNVRGVAPRNCGRYTVARAIMSAPEYAYGTFRTLWSQTGGAIKGKLRLAPLPQNSRLLHEFDSLPMGEVVRLVNKYSNNVMARHLLLTLGAEKFGAPATVDNGRRAVNHWMSERNIVIPGFVLDNGSGLSREERITARGLGQILHAAWHSQFMPEFFASLPLAATDGTLRHRFSAAGMQGRIRMKTGHIDDVANLAGYVNAVSGKQYIVVIFVNFPGAHLGVGDDIQAAVLRWVFAQ